MSRVATLWDEWADEDWALAEHASPADSITFPTTALSPKAWIALGADLTADPSTWLWEDITAYIRWDAGFNITVHRRDQTTTAPPGSAVLKLDNRDGRFTRRNPYGAYYGQLSKRTPIRIAVNPGDGDHVRYEGYVVSWPTSWNMRLNDSTVLITCAGFLRVAAQDTTQMSAMKRTILSSSPVAYWSCEDPSTATRASSSVSGCDPMYASGVSFAGQTGPAGSSGSTPDLATGLGMLKGKVSGGSSTAWHVGFAMITPYQTPIVARIYTTSATHFIYRVALPTDSSATTMTTFISGADGSVTGGLTGSVPANFPNVWHHYAISAQQVGGNVVSTFYTDGVQTATTTIAGTLGSVTDVLINHNRTNITSVAHIEVGDGVISTTGAAGGPALDGYDGETASARIARLCSEANAPFYASGASLVDMGPQPVSTWLDAVREAEAADNGLLYENGFGLGYQATWERYNVAAGFGLDFDLAQIAAVPEPADDDAYAANRVRASNSSAEAAVDDDDSISADGLFERSVTVNVPDDDLDDQAGWRVWVGSVDVDRWPRIDINLARSPELIPGWTTLRPGTRMSVAHPPDQMPPDNLDVFVEGWTEFFQTPRTWRASLFTSPAKPYDVGALSDDNRNLGWLEFDSCVLAVGVDSTATSWTISCSPADTSAATAFPRDHWIGGELVTVTASTGGTSPTWTVTRSVNGVVKSQAANASIKLADPVVLVVG